MLLLLSSSVKVLPSHNEVSPPYGNSRKTANLPRRDQRALGTPTEETVAPVPELGSGGVLRRVKHWGAKRRAQVNGKSVYP